MAVLLIVADYGAGWIQAEALLADEAAKNRAVGEGKIKKKVTVHRAESAFLRHCVALRPKQS
jgi:hypothetical protein